MNIKEIKKKVDVFKHDWEISRQCCDVEDFSDEVLYLLSIIERAEKDLETIKIDLCNKEEPDYAKVTQVHLGIGIILHVIRRSE